MLGMLEINLRGKGKRHNRSLSSIDRTGFGSAIQRLYSIVLVVFFDPNIPKLKRVAVALKFDRVGGSFGCGTAATGFSSDL